MCLFHRTTQVGRDAVLGMGRVVPVQAERSCMGRPSCQETLLSAPEQVWTTNGPSPARLARGKRIQLWGRMYIP